MTKLELEKFEASVTQTARGFVYPRTPGMPVLQPAGTVRRSTQRRLVLAALIVALAIGLALLAVPSVRAAVLRFLQIGVVRIDLQEPTPTPMPIAALFPRSTPNPMQPTRTPTVTPQPLAEQLNLFGKTTLTEARKHMRVKVPTVLGEPDGVYFQDVGGSATVLVWFYEARSGKVRISLQVFTSDVFAKKFAPKVLRTTQVKGKDAAWVQGEHVLKVRSGDYEVMQLVSANALIWTEDSYTYRLETNLTMEEAVKIAETTP